ncbi:MAG: hypothetical protein NVSMB23_27690 [Myxococcales bacterium]
MAARQMWLFLSENDVQSLLAGLEAHEPGLVASEGRYLRGDPQALLREPAALERREALPGERRLYLFHRKHSAAAVAHLQPKGPFAGWAQIDEERSDCLVLRVPVDPAGEAQPSRLYAHTSFWRGAVKTRKRPMFALWANQTLRRLIGVYPPSAVAFMHVGPDALARARAGSLRLTYLYRTIAPEPSPTDPLISVPEGTMTAATASAPDDDEGADQTSMVK